MIITREEAIIWLNSVLRNNKGNIDSNKIKSPKYKEYIEALTSLIEGEYTLLQKIWLIDRNLETVPICYCGKEVMWVKAHHEYSQYCSQKCAMNDPIVKEKRRQTNIEKYGCEAAIQNKDIQAKRKKTFIDRYGVPTSFERADFKEKSQKTLMKHFGVDNPQKSDSIKNRTKETNLKKYGATSPLHGSAKDKSIETMIEKYGATYAFQNKELFEKFKSTMLQRYGTEHALNNEGISSKETAKRFKKLYDRVYSGDRTHNKVIPLFSFEEYTGTEFKYRWKCVQCGQEFESHLQDGHIPRCIKCYPLMTQVSSHEKEIVHMLNSWGIQNIQTSVRTIISPQEIDIYIPDYNLAIEFHGLYWHSEVSGRRSSKYHLNKYNLCKDKGIDLIQIFEDEWLQKKDIVVSIIRNRLRLSTIKYFARKLEIREASILEQREFLDKNHIQGYMPATMALGLYSDATLVSLASFIASRYNKKINWELLRFATLPDTQVIGGLSRMIAYFKELHIRESIITYCDKRFFSGRGYEAVGFTKIKDSTPNYYYTKDYKSRTSRIQFQKHKLSEKLEIFDTNKTEFENMVENGYDRIWDAGMMVFVLR